MAIQFHPLPTDVFPEAARPYIGRLNIELRDLFGLEGTIKQPIVSSRSDTSIRRRAEFQVAVSRITPSIASVVSGVSTVVATPALIFGLTNTVGVSTSAVSINSAIALFGLSLPSPLAATAVAGTSAFASRADHVHLFPPTLRSTANASTLTLTDDVTDQILTGSLGILAIVPSTGVDIRFPASTAASLTLIPNTTTAASTVAFVQGRPVAGTRTLMAPNWFTPGASDIFSAQTFRCWDTQFVGFAGQHTGSIFVGYDSSTFAFSLSDGSGTTNIAYGARLRAGQFTTTGGWTEVAAAVLTGPTRSFGQVPVITTPAGLIVEPAVAGEATQYGILIRQQAAQRVATDRIGIEVLAQNSGTNRYAARLFNTLRVTNPSGRAENTLELRQLNTGATAGAHANFDDKGGDPAAPVTGDLWRNGDRWYVRDSQRNEDIVGYVARAKWAVD